jgi:tRNA-dihydrouridine synthase C
VAWLQPDRVSLALAPMEGISDAIVRDLLSALGAMDLCVTEFIRVAHRPVPPKVFRQHVPELEHGGRTPAGTPVMVQLLGGDPDLVAESATTAAEMGALGIDLNFGCPAKRVNGHDGGAALLRTPRRVTDVVRACVDRIGIPVSAKIRLGFDRPDPVLDLARAAEQGGAAWLTIHGRTKVQMYKGRADWPRIGQAARALSIPVVANGDLFTPGDLDRCQATTGCSAFMLGRGAFRTPNGFRWMRGWDHRPMSVDDTLALLRTFVRRVRTDPRFDRPERVALNRLKGWLRALAEPRPELGPVFDHVKRLSDLDQAVAFITRTSAAISAKQKPIFDGFPIERADARGLPADGAREGDRR